MIPQSFDYVVPASLAEAVDLISQGAKPLAGGQSLIPLMKLRLAAPERLVDLARVPELSVIRNGGAGTRIGATATHYQIESSPLINQQCPLLAKAAARIGDVQVRNLGTIGGSIAHADPAADYPAALLALDARVRIVSTSGERTVAIEDFFVDSFTTALEPGEIVAEVIVPAQPASARAVYYKVPHPASGFAVVGIAAVVARANGVVSDIHVGVTGLAGKGFRARAAERALAGSPASDAEITRAAQLVTEGQDANSDLYASAEYRQHLAVTAAARALRAALGQE
jgi:carbon-monoxide dehydrogenase medium subunit